MDFQKTLVIGRLTADPLTRGDNNPVTSFTVAVNQKYKSGDETKDETLYMPVAVWGRQAGPCAQYLIKGSEVLVEGRLRENKWEDKETGQKRSKFELIAKEVKFGRKPGTGSSDQQTSAGEYPDDVEPF